ncbi:hypothetical protein EOI86_15170 [Hwanghaeella grinnelliae]|uniref:Uncharacterized protein n=1 Tax=Hwanghaeella grinnelliae TaxID=2500179 RepID=A0A3S3UP31_9PROT|nr:hypothetical protein [Hwanghaeella grinnelliae]RVU36528.1 hypothetical protein EOI86_15170 [Hwanghaeella grinnelliae]
MTARSIDHNSGHGHDGKRLESGSDGGNKARAEKSGSLMRFARIAMRRKPALILLILSVCLILTVLYSWQLIRNGEVSGLVLVGANLCAFVIALVYLADDLLRR